MKERFNYTTAEIQFLKDIGFRVQYFRRKSDMSQEQLAEKSNLSYSTISHLEAAACYPISLVALYRIAGALDIPPSRLLVFD